MAVDKLVDSTVLDGYFEDIADAIRGKNGSSDTYSPTQMPQAITDIPSGGDDSGLKNLIVRRGTVSIPSDIGTIGPYAFCHHSFLTDTDIVVPEGIFSISQHAFDYSDLTSVTLPSTLTVCEQYAFSNMSSLHAVDFSACTRLTSIGNYMFYMDDHLTDIDFGNNAIQIRGSQTFYYCSNLEELVIPEGYTDTNASYTFMGCSKLKLIDLGSRTNRSGFFSYTFNGASSLKALVLRYTGSPPIVLYYPNCLQNSGISAGTGYIYVPRDSVAAYQAATNWSTYASQIRAVEDYTDDGTLTGKFIMPE